MPVQKPAPYLMVVDDSSSTLQFLETKLRERGYEVRAFHQGRLALQAAEQNPPDLIMLDIHMPDMTGYEVCEQIKRSSRLKDVPVLFLSKLNGATDKLKAFGVGAIDYVSKPFQIEEIEARILIHLELRRLQKETKQQNEHLEELVELRTQQLTAKTLELSKQNKALHREMTERKRAEEQLRQAQKMEAIALLAGGVAHDFNNILSAILMNCGLMQSYPETLPEIRSGLIDLETEAKRAAALTRQLLLFSRRQTLDTKPLNLNEVIGNLIKMLRRLIGEHIDFSFEATDLPLWVKADAGMIEQVVMNLCVNARDAMPQGGRLSILTQQAEITQDMSRPGSEVRPGRFVTFSVTDTGCGMDEATQKRIFEPFFTTKEQGKGTGLGLSTVYGIVKQHEGWIEVKSVIGQGSTFCVFIPAFFQPSDKSQGSMMNIPIRNGCETILLVEDDLSVRHWVALCLNQWGYTVLEAADGVEAMELWNEHQSRIDLLLTDMVMPKDISGLELAKRLRRAKSELKVIISSGYSPEQTRLPLAGAEKTIWLTKPYEGHALAKAIRDCLDQDS